MATGQADTAGRRAGMDTNGLVVNYELESVAADVSQGDWQRVRSIAPHAHVVFLPAAASNARFLIANAACA